MLAQLLAQTDVSITPRRFWRYSVTFWAVFGMASYLGWASSSYLEGQPFLLTDAWHVAVRYVLWCLCTPVILWAAIRYPLLPLGLSGRFGRAAGAHLLVFTVLGYGITYVEFESTVWVHQLRFAEPLPLPNTVSWLLARYTFSLAIYLILVLGLDIFLSTKRIRRLERQNDDFALQTAHLRSELSEAQLQALRMQLNPHFLFNTHQAIIGLMYQRENKQAIEMLTALSELLRNVVCGNGKHVISLGEELNFVRKYLSIQQIRFRDKLQVELQVTPEALACSLPQFVLQPLVENAVVHGVEGMDAGALIELTARVEDDAFLVISIRDNGNGRPRKRPNGTGTGLRNARARLTQLYEGAASLDFDHVPGRGACVTLRVPCAQTPASAAPAPQPVPALY